MSNEHEKLARAYYELGQIQAAGFRDAMNGQSKTASAEGSAVADRIRARFGIKTAEDDQKEKGRLNRAADYVKNNPGRTAAGAAGAAALGAGGVYGGRKALNTATGRGLQRMGQQAYQGAKQTAKSTGKALKDNFDRNKEYGAVRSALAKME